MSPTSGPVRKTPKLHRCRICLEITTGNYKSLKPSSATALIDYTKMFTFCVGFQIHFEKPFYPTVLCSKCETELLNVYKFMEKCRSTEQTLINVYQCDSADGANEIYENPQDFQSEGEDEGNEELDEPMKVEVETVYEEVFEEEEKPIIEFDEEVVEEAASNADEQLLEILQRSPTPSLSMQEMVKYESAGEDADQVAFETEYLIEETETEEIISSTRQNSFVILEPSEYIEQEELDEAEDERAQQEDSDEQHLHVGEEQSAYNHLEEQAESSEETGYQLEKSPASTKPTFEKIDAKTGICPICGKKLTIRSMARHVKNHQLTGNNRDVRRDTNDANKKFECNKCDSRFKFKVSLSHHMAHQHPPDGKKPEYQCKYCGRIFNVHGSWRHHLRMNHLDDKKHECTVCAKRFITATKLSIHMTSHRNDQPFQCSKCSRRFNRKSQLRQHETVTHSAVMRETCDVCSKQFKSKKYLRQHQVLHTQEKNYVCPVCGAEFVQNHVLRSHMHKLHPNFQLPPKGTVVSKKALQRMAEKAVEREKWVQD